MSNLENNGFFQTLIEERLIVPQFLCTTKSWIIQFFTNINLSSIALSINPIKDEQNKKILFYFAQLGVNLNLTTITIKLREKINSGLWRDSQPGRHNE